MVPVCAVWLTLFLVSSSVQAKAPLHRAPESWKRKDKNNCFIVRLQDDTPDDARQRLFEEMHGDSDSAVFFDKVFRGFGKCNSNLEQMEAFTENSFVVEVAEDQVVEAHTVQPLSDSLNPGYWNLDRIDQVTGLDKQYNYQRTGQGVNVYIVDSGVSHHTEFGARLQPGWSAPAVGGTPTIDCFGHGTHVAGTAAGSVSGVAKGANIVPVQVLDCNGGGTDWNVYLGLDWILQTHTTTQPKGVINLSLGGPTSTTMNAALDAVITGGYIVVASAGNHNFGDACQYSPGGHPNVITVGSTDTADYLASYSNVGRCVNLFAPGSWVYSTTISCPTCTSPSESHGYKSGTSMSSPLVAGVVAAYLQDFPSMNQADMLNKLTTTATPNRINGIPAIPADTPNLLLHVEGPAPTTATPTPTPTIPFCTKRGQRNCITVNTESAGTGSGKNNKGRRAGPADTAPPTAETPSSRSPTLLWFGVSLAGLLAAVAFFPRRHISNAIAPAPELLEEFPNSPPPPQQPSVCVAVKPQNEQVTEPRVRRASQFAL